MTPFYKKRREIVKSIPKFWPIALFRNSFLHQDLHLEDDQKILDYLNDVWVIRDPVEPRAFTIDFVNIFSSSDSSPLH